MGAGAKPHKIQTQKARARSEAGEEFLRGGQKRKGGPQAQKARARSGPEKRSSGGGSGRMASKPAVKTWSCENCLTKNSVDRSRCKYCKGPRVSFLAAIFR